MNSFLPVATLSSVLDSLRSAEVFQPAQTWLVDNAWHRPTDLAGVDLAALTAPLTLKELCTNRSLALNRLLFNSYEQSNLYLPKARFSAQDSQAFKRFYNPGFVAANALLRPALEQACFEMLDQEIAVEGPWTLAHLEEYCQELLGTYEATPSEVCKRVDRCAFPDRAARLFLLQVAPDFLSEASQMARALPGNFGPVHSELMKIFIDEFGYGVHQHKHSTLFERTVESVGLSSQVHAYYAWYLPTSLWMTSYFYLVTTNKLRWYEYVGALYWIEAVVPHFNRQFSRQLKTLFGKDVVDAVYFDEHTGIDMHHRRMVFDKLVRPMVATYGEEIIPDFVRGIAAARLLGDVAERDYLAQVDFCEALHGTQALPAVPLSRQEPLDVQRGFFLQPHVRDATSSLVVEAGEVEVDGGYLTPRVLRAGEGVVIPAGRMIGARVISEHARLRLGALPPEAQG